ncbi:Charged multivesicular body protein 7 [Trichuris trichiura]|uniref:Charged multivesicular body protein 7 n=1 Tax=Trichuris trichiura TaxID=36087 RepID=A0A077YUY8_TRITR|nr:Charged multivesicular body protein 7 [Trichuris trichiura]
MDSIVKDEERILNLMAKFRLREVNPTDYDSKLAFWKQTIHDYCVKRKCALFSVQELKEAFPWKGRVPACLDTVVSEMKRAGDAKTIPQFEESMEGWLSWSYHRFLFEPLSQLLASLTSSSSNVEVEEQYVFVSLIKEFADKIYELRNNVSDESTTVGQNVFTWSDFRENAADICSDETTLVLAVKHLKYNGLVATYKDDDDGDTILKFRMPHEKTLPTITESDISAVKLVKLKKQLQARIDRLCEKAESFEEDAKKHVAAKNTSAAKRSLRQKQGQLKKVDILEETKNNVLALLHQVESASTNKMVYDALSNSYHAFPALKGKDATVDKAYDVIDQVQQAADEGAEIAEAMSSNVTDYESSLELEKALDALLKSEAEKPKEAKEVPKLPERQAELPERKKALDRKEDAMQAAL